MMYTWTRFTKCLVESINIDFGCARSLPSVAGPVGRLEFCSRRSPEAPAPSALFRATRFSDSEYLAQSAVLVVAARMTGELGVHCAMPVIRGGMSGGSSAILRLSTDASMILSQIYT